MVFLSGFKCVLEIQGPSLEAQLIRGDLHSSASGPDDKTNNGSVKTKMICQTAYSPVSSSFCSTRLYVKRGFRSGVSVRRAREKTAKDRLAPWGYAGDAGRA